MDRMDGVPSETNWEIMIKSAVHSDTKNCCCFFHCCYAEGNNELVIVEKSACNISTLYLPLINRYDLHLETTQFIAIGEFCVEN